MRTELISPILLTTLLLGLTACQSTPEAGPSDTDARGTSTLPGAGISVQPANSDWLEEQFVTEIVNIGLAELGYGVEDVQQIDYAALNLAVASGEIDYTTGSYTVGHDDFFENAGGDEKLERLGILVPDGGTQAIMVDKKTAEQYQLNSLDQLQDPELAKLFDSDGDGKANLAGCQTGWQCGRIVDHFIEAYGLQDTLEQDQGAYALLVADVLARQAQGEAVMFYAYSPHWVLNSLKVDEDIVSLAVPFTALPGELAEMTEGDTTIDGKNLGFPVARQVLMANQAFVDQQSVAKRWFEVVEIPAADISRESSRIKDGENTTADIRRHAEAWVEENRTLFDNWLEDARLAAS